MDLNSLKDIYTRKDDSELLNVINNLGDFKTEVVEIVNVIISDRGGKEHLEDLLSKEIEKSDEAEKLREEIRKLLSSAENEEMIKEKLSTNLFPEVEKNAIIKEEIKQREAEEIDEEVTLKSFIGGLLGAFIGGTIGGILWGGMLVGSGKIFYLLGIGLILCCYFFVWLFSRKSKRNVATIFLTLISVVYALGLGWFVFQLYG